MTTETAIVRSPGTVHGLAIVEKYEAFQLYAYQILETCPRQHRVARDVAIAALFKPVEDLEHAARSQQPSRLREADAAFAAMRSHLRFLAHPKVRVITVKQHATALALLAEPGGMLNAWLAKLEGRARHPAAGKSAAGVSLPASVGRDGQSGK